MKPRSRKAGRPRRAGQPHSWLGMLRWLFAPRHAGTRDADERIYLAPF